VGFTKKEAVITVMRIKSGGLIENEAALQPSAQPSRLKEAGNESQPRSSLEVTGSLHAKIVAANRNFKISTQ
jgi:hypothetical protein